jgi:crotonobetainyl-CoA:carnitine CoA-transferase CaiB-like acyl-CoA transferase
MSTRDSSTADSAGPCAGLRVIDLTSLLSGPYATQVLADLGAEVIRVEGPGSDPLRVTPPLHNGHGGYFEQVNRGKKSIVVDLKSEEGKRAVLDLVATADVFIQNSRPGVMERLGFGYDALSAFNDRLIYLSINGFGETGPHASRPAYDTVIQAVVGFMPHQSGGGGGGAIRAPIADKITGMWAANAVLAALLDRERNGIKGQKVVVDMVSAYAAFTLVDLLLEHTYPDVELPKPPLIQSPFNTLDTSDGKVIGFILQPSQFQRLATALGHEELIADERFATPMGLMQNGEIFYEVLAPTIRKMTTKDFLALMDELSVPFGRVNDVAEFVASTEASGAKVFNEINDPKFGRIRHVNYPAKFEKSKVGAWRRAPLSGEHNDELLGPRKP